ncbi:tRNAHis guanylyltransferase [Sinorhizobium phage phiM12]|uniref:tRNAHis guanylyltransferase n=1 Tax=Sinorhizobium phage phiM12 TaxID=1357423 RepID=S5MAK4_9CAUD|nr:tRNA-His guanylyltransferase [Sinorhizobium phage phiM12]AGR47633.1 tRNAHis guanylyltransferase [Sinorhizobium phage phiM12]
MTKYENDPLGTRMKGYENDYRAYVGDSIHPPIYLYMRIDGRSFSNFTRELSSRGLLTKPRDKNFEDVFIRTVKDTVSEFNLLLGFHQSDEISLFFAPLVNPESQLLFDGNIQKLTSVVSSYFTSRFCYHFNEKFEEVPECSFDARIAAFKDSAEATNMLVWRYQDARRNLIQDIAHHQFGAKKLHKVSTREKFEMIGSPELRPGNFIKRVRYMLPVDTQGKVNVASEVARSRTDLIDVDFDSLDFDGRVALIYEKMVVPA